MIANASRLASGASQVVPRFVKLQHEDSRHVLNPVVEMHLFQTEFARALTGFHVPVPERAEQVTSDNGFVIGVNGDSYQVIFVRWKLFDQGPVDRFSELNAMVPAYGAQTGTVFADGEILNPAVVSLFDLPLWLRMFILSGPCTDLPP